MTATKPKETAAFICSRDTLDGAYPPLILGINAARAGMETKVFFTFMGINLACKGGIEKAKFIPPGVMGAVPGMSRHCHRHDEEEDRQGPDPLSAGTDGDGPTGRGGVGRLQDDYRHDGIK